MLNAQTDESYVAYLLDMINYKLFLCSKIIKNASFNEYINNVGLYLGAIIGLYNVVTIFIFFCYFTFKIRMDMFKQIPTQVKLFERAKELVKNKNKKNKENNIDNSLKHKNIPSNPKKKNNIKIAEKQLLKMIVIR